MRQKGFYRVAVALALTLAIIAALFFSSPVKAVTVSSTIPSTMYTARFHMFLVQVDINTNEQIPISEIRLDISGPTPRWVTFSPAGVETGETSDFFSISLHTAPYYGPGYGYGYGYGYQPGTGYGYFGHWWGYGAPGYGYGYGYGYGGYAASTSGIYRVTLYTSGMAEGLYTARVSVDVGDPVGKKFLSPTYDFSIAAAPVGAAAPAVAAVTAVGSVDLTPYLDSEGKTTVDISLSSPDGLVTIFIPAGTKVLDAVGNPLGSIEIVVLSTPPPPSGYALVGPAYDCRPDGATFEPAITLTFTYDPADIPAGVSEEDLVMAYWDGDKWVMLPTTVNTVANTVTVEVAHFTPFAILAKVPAPAAFAVSDLSITPAEVDIGEKVTISTLVTNTGDLAGSYEVTLKIDEVVVATRKVTLTGGASHMVTFTTAKDVAGTYAVTVDGLSGTFKVKAVPVVPPVVPPVIPPVIPPKPVNWWLIGGIIAGCIIIGVIVWQVLRRRA